MQWAHPERWVWVCLTPTLIGFLAWAFRRRRRALERFASPGLLPHLADRVDWNAKRAKATAGTLGVLFLLLALVGPQWGFRWQEVTRRGADLVIALDVSKSMLAEDVRPNRLERAKLAVHELLSMLHGDRIGLVAFAGTSFIQCPLTMDYGAFALALDELSTDTIPRGGTALAQAIRESLKMFASSAPESRALVLITDGESHEGDTLVAAKEAVKAGVKVFAIGIGTPEGELIPITDEQGHKAFLKDREGRTVKSRLDEAALKQVALETGGSYVHATATSFGLDLVYNERIAKLTQQESGGTMTKQYEQRFQWLLAVALVLLACEPLISDRTRMAR